MVSFIDFGEIAFSEHVGELEDIILDFFADGFVALQSL